MANAAVTFVYNEAVNLPIWSNYYGRLFGHENLFVIDRSSDDGSTDRLGKVNVIRIPRNEFDENAKTLLMSSFHAALTSTYDAVIISDCDEVLVPDPAQYRDLSEYIEKLDGDYVNAVGLDIMHLITEEMPLDLGRPILSQRKFGRFHAPECKQSLSRIPIHWLPGLHSSNKPPRFDANLFLFHLKLMDFGIATARQKINVSTIWSESSLKANFGGHHRDTLNRFVRHNFLSTVDLVNRKEIREFDFSAEIVDLQQRTTVDANGFHRVPMNVAKMVEFPERFRSLL